ncbi:hypothetical protein Asp14428_27530 [Actinoplanes sp. NBRC 14428]|nr:hypothetical protein Asp14428_27530 [Actinoplanes sp. NBRC 14428]
MMDDDEVLAVVKRALSDVRMDRPVEAIERRGRARRRNRAMVAGGALAAVGALALAAPMAFGDSAPGPSGTAPQAAGGQEPVAFKLVNQTDGSVRLTLDYRKLLNPAALEKALDGAGIAAVVKDGVYCSPRKEQLPEAKQVFGTERAVTKDGSQIDLVIRPAKMPAGSVAYFSVFPTDKGEGNTKFAKFLVPKGAAMDCRTIG